METRPYENLQPETILASVEQAGFMTNGRLLALNSYENRVYQVGVEDARPVVVKFYRPGRWSDEAILEEHAFALELTERDIPVVPPIEVEGETLLQADGYRFAVYRSCGGRWPELGTAQERRTLGRFLGRLHMVGCAIPFRHRPGIDVDRLGRLSRDWLLDNGWIPPHLEAAYDSLTETLVDAVQERIALAGNPTTMRIHGDCHLGNILWTDDGPHFVDLDDCVTGPAVHDLLDGYREFADFDTRELWLIEALRTLRIMHYQAWIARRWEDPAFPRAFPWFEETRNWEDHILALREQAAHLQEGPLQL